MTGGVPSAPDRIAGLSAAGRRAAAARDWPAVVACSKDILHLDRQHPEGWFLAGLAAAAEGRLQQAADSFARVVHGHPERYDAGIELARLYRELMRHADAKELLEHYGPMLSNSPLYLSMAAATWSRLGLHDRAWPLYFKAHELQPEIERFREELAASSVLVGRIDEARSLYLELLERFPEHQRNHYELSRLGPARDRSHVEQMLAMLDATGLPPERNIFVYYAIAKELEDLGEWDESFRYYRLAGDAAAGEARRAGYDVAQDIELIERIIERCNPAWLEEGTSANPGAGDGATPIFVVGLPRTGTTLTERIIGSHSQVESADETFFLQIAVRRVSGVPGGGEVSPRVIEFAARAEPSRIAEHYRNLVAYRLSGKPLFIDKYPFNYLYLGFIARAFPTARIVDLRRDPMDACFAMYKQSFFRFAYTLDDLARYYLAYDRLSRHWREHLGERIVEIRYESLVADPEPNIRDLLERLGLPFERACVDFHLNAAPSATASAAQVREKAHTRSVARWKKFEKWLQPLREQLEAGGIEVG